MQGGSLSGEPSGGLSCHPCRGRHCPGRAPGSPCPQAMSTGGWRSLVALPLLPTAPSFHAQTQFLELAMPSPASACQAHLPSLHPLTYEVPAQTSLPPGSPLRPPAALLAHPSTSRPHSIRQDREAAGGWHGLRASFPGSSCSGHPRELVRGQASVPHPAVPHPGGPGRHSQGRGLGSRPPPPWAGSLTTAQSRALSPASTGLPHAAAPSPCSVGPVTPTSQMKA